MAFPDIRRQKAALLGQIYRPVPFMFQEPLIFQRLKGRKHRRLTNPQAGSNVGYPDFTLVGEKTDHFQVIFKRLSHIK
jgi:hypothetical protein